MLRKSQAYRYLTNAGEKVKEEIMFDGKWPATINTQPIELGKDPKDHGVTKFMVYNPEASLRCERAPEKVRHIVKERRRLTDVERIRRRMAQCSSLCEQ